MYLSTKLRFNKCSVNCDILIDTGALSNLVSVSTISRLPKLPRIRKLDTHLTGANKTKLHCIGSTTLNVTLGNSEKLVKFYVVEDLATTAILGRRSIKNLKGKIDLDTKKIKFGSDHAMNLIFPDKQIQVRLLKTVKLDSGSYTTITGKANQKLQIRGTHLLSASKSYHHLIVDQIVDTFNGKLDIVISNGTNKRITINKGTVIGSIKPLDTTQTSLMVLNDEETIPYR